MDCTRCHGLKPANREDGLTGPRSLLLDRKLPMWPNDWYASYLLTARLIADETLT